MLLPVLQTLDCKAAVVVVTLNDGTVVYINNAGERVMGWPLEDLKDLNVKVYRLT